MDRKAMCDKQEPCGGGSLSGEIKPHKYLNCCCSFYDGICSM